MKFLIDKSFKRDFDKLKNIQIKKKFLDILKTISKIDSIQDLQNIKKLEIGKNYYRLRIGDYRIGMIYKNSEIIFVRCLHRKEIYKYFP